MKIGFILSENETHEDVNNFTVANALYKECNNLPQLNARVVADMIIRQCVEDETPKPCYGYMERQ